MQQKGRAAPWLGVAMGKKVATPRACDPDRLGVHSRVTQQLARRGQSQIWGSRHRWCRSYARTHPECHHPLAAGTLRATSGPRGRRESTPGTARQVEDLLGSLAARCDALPEPRPVPTVVSLDELGGLDLDGVAAVVGAGGYRVGRSAGTPRPSASSSRVGPEVKNIVQCSENKCSVFDVQTSVQI